jgi:D-alanyl-D-alanine carboxypeptidase
MRHYLRIIYIIIIVAGVQPADAQPPCSTGIVSNANFTKATAIDSILKKYTGAGVPGVSVAVYTPAQGWWESAAGFSNIENKTPMQPCRLQYLQSVSKTYLAVAILQLKEKGKVDLEKPITKYLPVKYSKHISNADQITVRMLLNHTAGIPDYATNAGFAKRVVEQPLLPFTREHALTYISKEPPLFEPGTDYSYSNTNYLMLSVIADVLTGDHTVFISKNILVPLGATNTHYKNDYLFLDHLPTLTSSYWDLFGNGTLVNIDKMQRMNVACIKGDDGMVSTPADVVKFMRGLMEGKLLSDASMKEMQTWATDKAGNPEYGLGLIYFKIGDLVGYGHGGGGLGAGCLLLYVPSRNLYCFFAVNIGVVLTSTPLLEKVDEMKTALLNELLFK